MGCIDSRHQRRKERNDVDEMIFPSTRTRDAAKTIGIVNNKSMHTNILTASNKLPELIFDNMLSHGPIDKELSCDPTASVRHSADANNRNPTAPKIALKKVMKTYDLTMALRFDWE